MHSVSECVSIKCSCGLPKNYFLIRFSHSFVLTIFYQQLLQCCCSKKRAFLHPPQKTQLNKLFISMFVYFCSFLLLFTFLLLLLLLLLFLSSFHFRSSVACVNYNFSIWKFANWFCYTTLHNKIIFLKVNLINNSLNEIRIRYYDIDAQCTHLFLASIPFI